MPILSHHLEVEFRRRHHTKKKGGGTRWLHLVSVIGKRWKSNGENGIEAYLSKARRSGFHMLFV
jgi:hypothetical protein